MTRAAWRVTDAFRKNEPKSVQKLGPISCQVSRIPVVTKQPLKHHALQLTCQTDRRSLPLIHYHATSSSTRRAAPRPAADTGVPAKTYRDQAGGATWNKNHPPCCRSTDCETFREVSYRPIPLAGFPSLREKRCKEMSCVGCLGDPISGASLARNNSLTNSEASGLHAHMCDNTCCSTVPARESNCLPRGGRRDPKCSSRRRMHPKQSCRRPHDSRSPPGGECTSQIAGTRSVACLPQLLPRFTHVMLQRPTRNQVTHADSTTAGRLLESESAVAC